MPSKSKTKGNNFERDIAAKLTESFGEPFLRVPSSGAFLGGSNYHRMDRVTEQQARVFRGDIIPPESLSNLKIECKSYGTFSFGKLWTGKHRVVDEWIEQAQDKNCTWLLVFKITPNLGTYVLYDAARTLYSSGNQGYMCYQNRYIIELFDGFLARNVDNIRRGNDVVGKLNGYNNLSPSVSG